MEKIHFKDWKGSNRFFLKGRLMTGSSNDNLTLIFCYGYIIAITIIYSFTLSQYLTKEYGSLYSNLGYFFFSVCFFFQLKTTFSDPGVIPRGGVESAEEALQVGLPIEREDDDSLLGSSSTSSTTSDRVIDMIPLKGTKAEVSLYKFRHCSTCKIMRPPKSSHCGDCNNCVKGFDHHCFFVGNCIGRRNHHYFFYFLLFGTLYSVYVTLFCVIGFVREILTHDDVRMKLGNQSEYWILAAVFIVLPFLCCSRPYALQGIRNTFMGLGLLITLIGLTVACKGVDVPYYEAPLTFVLVILLLSPITIWVLGAFLGCLQVISLDLTNKEKAVIQREILDAGRKFRIFSATPKERIANFKSFFIRPWIDSHISM